MNKNEEIFKKHFNEKMHGSLEDFKNAYRTLYGVILSSMEEAVSCVKPSFSDEWLKENDTNETVVPTTISEAVDTKEKLGLTINTDTIWYVEGVKPFVGRVKGAGSLSNHYYFKGHPGIVTLSAMYPVSQDQLELLGDQEIYYLPKK